jgi:hypothetical protein
MDSNIWIDKTKNLKQSKSYKPLKLSSSTHRSLSHFRVQTAFRSLVCPVTLLQRCWEQLWLFYYHKWTSWGKFRLLYCTSLWHQVGLQYPLFVHCNLWSSIDIIFNGICVQNNVWTKNDVALYRHFILFYGITNRCDNVQWNLFLCKSTLQVSGGTHAHHQEYNLNCINSHWYNSYCKK